MPISQIMGQMAHWALQGLTGTQKYLLGLKKGHQKLTSFCGSPELTGAL